MWEPKGNSHKRQFAENLSLKTLSAIASEAMAFLLPRLMSNV